MSLAIANVVILVCCWLATAARAESPLASEAAAMADLEATQMEPVPAFLKDGGDPNSRDEYGSTLLEVAVNWNRVDVVKALLDRGADPNLCVGECPLYTAVGGDTEIVRLLVLAGADVNRTIEKLGYSPLGRAAGTQANYEELRSTGHYRGPAPDALEAVRILVGAGANVNHVDNFDQSPLRSAIAVTKNLEIAKVLLAAGANVHQRSSIESMTILMYAIWGYSDAEDLAAIDLLLEYGADPNDRHEESYDSRCVHARGGCGWRGYSVLTYAASLGLYDVARLLLERGADPSLPRTDGRSAVELAHDNKHPKTAALIEEYLARKSRLH